MTPFPPQEQRRVVSGLQVGIFVAALDSTLVSVALLSIARDLGIPAASSGSLALPTKPVYEPPPPVNIGPAGPSKPSGAKPFKPRFPPVDTGSGATPGATVPAAAPTGAKQGGLSRPAR